MNLRILPFIAAIFLARIAVAATPALPAAATDHILFAQIADSRVPDLSVLVGKRAYIWAAKVDSAKLGLYAGSYYPSIRDLNRAHTLAWFQKNHPDWVLYQADRKTPAYGFTYSWGAYIPLDFTRPDVRQYLFATYLGPAIQRGFPAISYDNVSIDNGNRARGVWRDGQWVQLYNGDTREPAYAAAILDYIGWVRDRVHAAGAAFALNAKVDVPRPDLTWQLLTLGDIWLDEGGVTHAPHDDIVDQVWKVKFALASRKAAVGGYVQMNKLSLPYAQMTPPLTAWILANFLLVRGPHSYLAVLGQEDDGKFLDYTSKLDPPVGAPTGPAQDKGAYFQRPYEKGWAIVNPSSLQPASIPIPAGNWIDLQGQPISGTVSLPPHSGLVLIKK